jgi:hypothetical protein
VARPPTLVECLSFSVTLWETISGVGSMRYALFCPCEGGKS